MLALQQHKAIESCHAKNQQLHMLRHSRKIQKEMQKRVDFLIMKVI